MLTVQSVPEQVWCLQNELWRLSSSNQPLESCWLHPILLSVQRWNVWKTSLWWLELKCRLGDVCGMANPSAGEVRWKKRSSLHEHRVTPALAMPSAVLPGRVQRCFICSSCPPWALGSVIRRKQKCKTVICVQFVPSTNYYNLLMKQTLPHRIRSSAKISHKAPTPQW